MWVNFLRSQLEIVLPDTVRILWTELLKKDKQGECDKTNFKNNKAGASFTMLSWGNF
jgi:hypothetical protein